jgi:hypothetical protein
VETFAELLALRVRALCAQHPGEACTVAGQRARTRLAAEEGSMARGAEGDSSSSSSSLRSQACDDRNFRPNVNVSDDAARARPNRAARLVLTRLLVLVLTRRLLHQHPDRRAFAPVASAVRA